MILEAEGNPIDFLLDMGATFSVLLSNPRPPSTHYVMVKGVTGKPITKFFSQPLGCIWGNIHAPHHFQGLLATNISHWLPDSRFLRYPALLFEGQIKTCFILNPTIFLPEEGEKLTYNC